MLIELSESEFSAINEIAKDGISDLQVAANRLGLDRDDVLSAAVRYLVTLSRNSADELSGLLADVNASPREILNQAFAMDRENQAEFFVPRLIELNSLFVDQARAEDLGATITRVIDYSPRHDSRSEAPPPKHSRRSVREKLQTFKPEQIIGTRFVLEQRIGFGGFAWVWRATDRATGTPVAVKLQGPPGAHSDCRTEAELLLACQHPNVVPVYSWGDVDDDINFLALRLCRGDLERLTSAQPLPVNKVAFVIASIAAALEFVHGQGVIHRDIKPANVLIDEAGRPYLSDFGLATTVELAAAGDMMAGTMGYASPEQMRGEPLDKRSDIFSLGVVLYELLARQRFFARPKNVAFRTAAYLYMAQFDGGTLRHPAECNPDVPIALKAVCLRAMAVNPDDRFASASEFLDALREFVPVSADLLPTISAEFRERIVWNDGVDVYAAVDASIGYLALARETGSIEAEATAFANLGESMRRLGKDQRAMEMLNNSLRMAREQGNLRLAGDVLWSLSKLHHQLGNRGAALESAQDAAAVLQRTGSSRTHAVLEWLHAHAPT